MTASTLVRWACLCLCLLENKVDSACHHGWFGQGCRYPCNCRGNHCLQNGDCEKDVTCKEGMFGHKCQNIDGAATSTMPDTLKYKRKKTCSKAKTTSGINFTVDVEISWIRMYARSPGQLQASQIMIEFDNGAFKCENFTYTSYSNTIIDVSCANSKPVRHVALSGPGISGLCTFLLNAGRNLALKQNVTQTGVYLSQVDKYGPLRAIDQDLTTCSITQRPGPAAKGEGKFTLELVKPILAYRVILHNMMKAPGKPERMNGFDLHLYDPKNNLLVTWSGANRVMDIHTIRLALNKPVKKIVITGSKHDREVQICELQVLGDILPCDEGKYGLDCELPCNKCLNHKCLPSSGSCIKCPVGKRGITCDHDCPTGFYGDDCKHKCPGDCKYGKCFPQNGTCDDRKPKTANDLNAPQRQRPDCPPGQMCEKACPANCKGHVCDPVNRTCFECLPGFTGESCENECPNGSFGSSCAFPCPVNCDDRRCHKDSGVCWGCQEGYIGTLCNAMVQERPDDPTLTYKYALIPPVLLFVLYLVVLLWKRYGTEDDEGEDTTGEGSGA